MFGADKGSVAAGDSRINGKKLKIGIVQARFNANITDALAAACKAELLALGVAEKDITHVTVPGALEVAVALQALAEKTGFDALVALGCIIRGETYHFELVSNESAAGITRVSLDAGLPIANGVLTCDTDEQAHVRVEVKGADCARAVIEMANLALALIPDLDIEINPNSSQ